MSNFLLARIKNRKQYPGNFKIILSEKGKFFECINYDDAILYTPHNISTEKIMYLENFSSQDFFPQFLKNEFNSVEFDSFSYSEVSKIDYIFAFQEGEFFFQNITKSKLVKRKFIAFLGSEFDYQDSGVFIVINEFADAIYDKVSDRLYFRKLEAITSVFPGIDTVYREATQSEIDGFLQNDFFALQDMTLGQSIGKLNRKRIALAIASLNSFDDEQKRDLIGYISQYVSDVSFEEERFVIESESQLEKVVYGILEKYYETPVSKERRCANSTILVE